MISEKIWILGGGGLVGEGLKSHSWDADTRYLSSHELNILKNPDSFQIACDTIIDLVPSPFVSLTEANEEDYHKVYTYPHIEFISKALASGVKNYIFVSSGGSVYGNATKGALLSESTLALPVSNYGKSKLKIEEALSDMAQKLQVRHVILRPGNIFNHNPQSKCQRGLVGALLDCVKNDKPFNMFGTGVAAKDYISNKDVGSAIISAAQSKVSGIYNVGTERAYSIQEIIEMFEYSFKKKIHIEKRPAYQSDVEWNCLSNKKAANDLNFKPQDNLPDWLNYITKDKF